uniref:C-type lectin domain-containing protein n=1 Tax=Poecilia latipinna TaxID=48699 RepID=A0A3B3VD24_9TELE
MKRLINISAGDMKEAWIGRSLYQFHYINENKNWTEAQQYCREKHTDLVTVTNMKDMKRLIKISARYMKDAWIGLIMKFNESETNWKQGEPSDRGIKGSENCGAMYQNQNLTWQDQGCHWSEYFLCYDGEY